MSYIFGLNINSEWEQILSTINKFDFTYCISENFWSKANKQDKESLLEALTQMSKNKIKTMLENHAAKKDGVFVNNVVSIKCNPLEPVNLKKDRVYVCELVVDNYTELVLVQDRTEILNAVKVADITNIFNKEI